MINSDSLTILPQAEVNEGYTDDELNPSAPSGDNPLCDHNSSSSRIENVRQLRKRLSNIVHGQTYQIAVIVLVLIDAATVLAILIIDTSVKDRHNHGAKLATEVFHYTSICILFSFLIEIVVKIFALGLDYFKHKMELFDACIVITSFVLDLVMLHGTAAEIIILFRLWRVTRIINGVVMSVKRKSEKEKRHLTNQNEELSEQLHQCELKITAQKKEIVFLRGKLESLGIKIDETLETNST